MNDLERMIDAYRPQYGDETEALFASMAAPQNKIALINQFLPAPLRAEMSTSALSYGHQFADLTVPPDLIDDLMSHYFLDLSSIFAPLLLPIAPGDRVLDMCSAPGGKILVMLSRQIADVNFVANDLSPARNNRLRRVINEYVPADVIRDHIKITTKDGVSFALKDPASFDAVLLDAPCSSEAHIVQDPQLLKKFNGLRKTLPQRQYTLLSAALLAVKPGGHVIYATCSINREENEGVIKKALARKKMPCAVVPVHAPVGDHNEYGVTILPHRHGVGPAFFSLLKRL